MTFSVLKLHINIIFYVNIQNYFTIFLDFYMLAYQNCNGSLT